MITVKDIHFKYSNSGVETLKGASLHLEKGNVLAVVGPSGGGKSTLLRLIAGLENPSQGKIIIDNKVMWDKETNVKPEKRGVGMVFQDYALFPHMTVQRNIEFGITHLSKNERKKGLKKY